MNLQAQMDAVKKSFVEQVPEQTLDIMAHSAGKLQDSGIVNQTVKAGDKAPAFSLINTLKSEVSLSKLLTNGPVVLSFFRGRW